MARYTATETTSHVVAQAFSNSAIFRLLSEEKRAWLAAKGRMQAFEAGATLFRVGDEGDAVFILIEGEVEVRVSSPDGQDVRIASIMAGNLFGEMAALDGGARSADIAALRRTRVWRVPRTAITEALESEPKAAMALIAELCLRIRSANNALVTTALLDLGGRLARLLLQERNARGVISLSQTELARRIGASREAVNRKLRQWVHQGRVQLLPVGVSIIDAPFFEDMVASASCQ